MTRNPKNTPKSSDAANLSHLQPTGVSGAVRAEIAPMPPLWRSSALAAAALDLAARLDDSPTDRDATGLVRELRLVMAELRGLAATGEVGLDVGSAEMGR